MSELIAHCDELPYRHVELIGLRFQHPAIKLAIRAKQHPDLIQRETYASRKRDEG